MRRKIIFAPYFLLCVLAGFGGYYVAMPSESKQPLSNETLHLRLPSDDTKKIRDVKEHYIARIEENTLFIYKMPEYTVYDLLEKESLHFADGELKALHEGIVFATLPEVYEFLENGMS